MVSWSPIYTKQAENKDKGNGIHWHIYIESMFLDPDFRGLLICLLGLHCVIILKKMSLLWIYSGSWPNTIGLWEIVCWFMLASSNGNIFCVTGPLCGEFTGHRRIPLTKASDAEIWYFLWSAPEQTVEQTIETPVIWDAIALIMTSL